MFSIMKTQNTTRLQILEVEEKKAVTLAGQLTHTLTTTAF